MSDNFSPKALEIMEHTRSLLELGGYNSFSYADISERVHIRKASIHHHFPNKAELVRVVVEQYREEARAGLEALNRNLDDPVLAIEAYVDYWTQCIVEGTSPMCICALLAMELPSIPVEIADQVRAHFKDLTDWLTGVFEKGAAQQRLTLSSDPATEASAFLATVHGAMLSARGTANPEMFHQIVKHHIRRLMT
ncbi:hypothetical protein TDB9533_03312 [Thalassocella blandensis]|nr:hypothetical protein TDB9533_03312 [Thalassocella blandensis]